MMISSQKEENKMKSGGYVRKAILLIIVLGLLYEGVASVLGVQGASSVSAGASSRATYDNTSTATIPVQAGNVTELNISAMGITDHWAGFYGDISGNITLSDGSDNVFYDWTGLNALSGEVFASNESDVVWSGIGCASAAEITDLETFLGISPTDADRINQTYTTNSHPDFTVGGTPISGCNTTNAYINGGTKDASTFYQVLLTDTNGAPVFTTLINDSTTGFDNAAHDFQLLVGEPDSAGTTAMYFYIELS
jgi:hypothetical protein